MYRFVLVTLGVLISHHALVCGKQQVKLSDSYLPVAMQVIAHLTDQMSFEAKDEIPPPKPTKATTQRPPDQTTQYHRPGLFAPPSPPRHRWYTAKNPHYVLLPMQHSFFQYSFLEPKEKKQEEPLLAAQTEQVNPIVDPTPNVPPLLPPLDDMKITSRSESAEELNEENLQYLSPNVREMIRMANDPDDDRIVDTFGSLRGRGNPPEPKPKGKLSSTNLRLLLLYDLLSRDAKKQKLNSFVGFSDEVMKNLVESSSGGARAQLSMALSNMVSRHDCTHDYANNRAKEMVAELARDESLLSTEIRYLQPLIYKY
ncbi:uncharacterized protein LOC121727645 [Aricia agestis]|uniref:uncharacterized protein LOC121727645 n=1 Tax=Aricia agestis TaxID=91739 RepID=UPI001C208A7F|nr:uncharacterized protein LOC121727645 [Aricia agestis]